MDTQVPGQIGDLSRQVGHRLRDVFGLLTPGVLLSLRETQRAGHVTDRTATSVGDHIGHLRGVITAVTAVDVLDDLLTQIRLDIDVDIGRTIAGR